MSVERYVRRATRGFALGAALAAAGSCAAPDDFSTPIPDEPITQTEQSAGVDESGQDYAEPDESTDGEVAALAPIAADVRTDDEGSDTATATSGATACRAATGYVGGVARSLCVTSIDGKLVEVNTAGALLRMRAAASRAGVRISVVSGFRTMAKQRELYNLWRAGRGNRAARPGFSNHQSGHALDLNTSAAGVLRWLNAHGSAYGFRRTVSDEPWHWEHW